MMGSWVLAAALGYLLGSVPFGLVLPRLAGHGDIRKIGSGNIGATNVLRTGNKPLALAVLILDSGKGAAAVLLSVWLLAAPPAPDAGIAMAAALAGTAAVLGHNFPVWLKFKGGKGVATTLGTLIALAWPVGLAACATWVLIAALFRYSSLAALAALCAAPGYAMLAPLGGPDPVLAAAAGFLALLALIRHEANIRRLLAGTEPKIGRKA